jgi:hypothetical protein
MYARERRAVDLHGCTNVHTRGTVQLASEQLDTVLRKSSDPPYNCDGLNLENDGAADVSSEK